VLASLLLSTGIHLDIAGTAWIEEYKPWIAKGPSGIALRSLVEFLKGWSA